ncbi:hypothetical protein IEC97_14690 [Neobacillus cucumis]|uniref:DNA primase family protein n=1 Tax=Neobacillus cucumis TaxID=1740721 RepID=UPI0018DFC6BF|nr:phage/plasmid primase, P4 family [Neobacillus cucumis]MBI0578611.1 hypothetical protein [Neobacillus cucumis]
MIRIKENMITKLLEEKEKEKVQCEQDNQGENGPLVIYINMENKGDETVKQVESNPLVIDINLKNDEEETGNQEENAPLVIDVNLERDKEESDTHGENSPLVIDVNIENMSESEQDGYSNSPNIPDEVKANLPSSLVNETSAKEENHKNIQTDIKTTEKHAKHNQNPRSKEKNDDEKKFVNNLELNISNKLMERHHLKCLKGNLYLYSADKGYFIELEEDYQIRTLVRTGWTSKIEGLLSKSRVDDIIDRLRSCAAIQITEDDLDPYPNLINFNDCVLNVKTGDILNHSPDYCFTSFINANYCNKYTEGKSFLKFIDQCTNGDENKVNQLQELIGYSISNYSNAKKWFTLIGKPHTGKSTFLEILTEIIGEEYTSNVPLHELSSKFALADLFKKKLNVSGELNDAVLKNINVIKAITGNDRLRADRKYQSPINFINRAKIVMASNVMPQLKTLDNTSAFIDRIVFIIFNNSIPEDKRDYKLKEKLIKEKDFIVRWAVKGLKRLIKNNFVFTECRDSIDFKKQYQNEMSNINDFIQSVCILNPSNDSYKVHKKDLYDAYLNYSRDNCQNVLNKRDFFNEIKKLHVKQAKFRFRKSNPLDGYIGITLKRYSNQQNNL